MAVLPKLPGPVKYVLSIVIHKQVTVIYMTLYSISNIVSEELIELVIKMHHERQ